MSIAAVYLYDEGMKRPITDIYHEAQSALAKHGPPTPDPCRLVAILAEELGEVAEHALKLTSRDPREQTDGQGAVVGDNLRLIMLRGELCQLAGYALLQIKRIDDLLDQTRQGDKP